MTGGRGNHRSLQGGLIFNVNIYTVPSQARLFAHPLLRTARYAEIGSEITAGGCLPVAVSALAVAGAQAQAVRAKQSIRGLSSHVEHPVPLRNGLLFSKNLKK